MHYSLLQILLLLSVAFLLIMLAGKLKISYPIFLVVAGIVISFIPGIPVVSLNPDLIFLIFLPPLLYDAAWFTSWNDFWKWKRSISQLSVLLVIVTSCIVAFAAKAMIPSFTLPMGFLLGGIIAPTDAVSAGSVLKTMKLPKRIATILEGESLVNDASGLIVFRFALAALLTGQFSLHQAISDFFVVTLMGISTGLGVAYLVYCIHRYLPTTPSINTAFTLLSPYFMYLIAEQFHFSGVIATVSGGLFLSYRSHKLLTDGQSRLQTLNVWATLIVILNGLVFILIGLELPVITGGLKTGTLAMACTYGLFISAIVITIRLVCVYPSAFIPRLFKSIKNSEANPGWKSTFVIGWSGMRGVVSLAAALSLPLVTDKGQLFPNRSLIIFIAFVVILITLVLQGLSLPALIRFLKIEEVDPVVPDEQQEAGIKIRMIEVALSRLENHYSNDLAGNDLLKNYQSRLLSKVSHQTRQLACLQCDAGDHQLKKYKEVLQDIFQMQRNELYQLRKAKKFSDRMLRKEEVQVDLAEVKIIHPSRF